MKYKMNEIARHMNRRDFQILMDGFGDFNDIYRDHVRYGEIERDLLRLTISAERDA